MTLSAVINTWNEEKNVRRALTSIVKYVDEIIVVDMESKDKTLEIAAEFGAKIWSHPYLSYVEPARNFAINKAQGTWIFLLDADEIVSDTLGVKFKRLIEHGGYDYFRIPRKNLIFGKWIAHSGWWPDYQIRLFKKANVVWNDEIHSVPITKGKGIDLRPEEKNALIHHHYEGITQYLEKLNRYTTEEAKELIKSGYKFSWNNVIKKPVSEFFSRFFIWEGYKDGFHGLALSFLQAISFLIVQLKVWESEGFPDIYPHRFLDEIWTAFHNSKKELNYWYHTKKSLSENKITQFTQKILARIKI